MIDGYRPANLNGRADPLFVPRAGWQSDAPPPQRLDVFSAADLAGRPAPQRLFHVNGLIPAKTVTLLGGDGGTGKSLLAKQLAAATALNTTWLGLPVVGGRALFVTAEDDRDEVHRRLEDIVEHAGRELSDLRDLHLVSWAGEDALLATQSGKSILIAATPKFAALDAAIGDIKPALVVLDTLADLFGGAENDRAQARQFIGMLRGLALRHDTTLLLLAHPSLSGLSSGSGTSGSTGWSNSVRSRLYLERVKDEDGVETDPDIRVLRIMKANYSPIGGEYRMRYQAGVLVPTDAPTVIGSLAVYSAKDKADQVFLDLIVAYQAEGRAVSATPSANFAPTILARDPRSQGVAKRGLTEAMNRLFNAKRIKVVEFGPPSKKQKQIVVCNPEVVE